MSPSEEPQRHDHNGKIEIQLEQVRSLNRWILGLLGTLLIFGAGWMIKMADDIATLKADSRTAILYADITKTAVASMTEAATTGLRASTRAEESIKALEFRVITLETERAKGGRFTAEDGSRLAERVRIIEDGCAKHVGKGK